MLPTTTRRAFLGSSLLGLASTSSFAGTIARALATPANLKADGLGNIEHIVFLMQENRSFDSYFGALGGVRGFNDPRAIMLPTGKPVWYQPSGANYVLPYHFDIRNTNALRVGLDHSWKGTEAAWKDWNAWVAKKSNRTMGFFDRGDLPFYYAAADAFTVCDDYHCSIFGPTDPNRFYALSGRSSDRNMGGIQDGKLYNVVDGTYSADIANDTLSADAPNWGTYAEILQANGIDWKVYQEWDNYGDNYLQYFRNFRVDAAGKPLTPDSPLYQRGRRLAPGSTRANASGTTGQWLIDDFAADVRAGKLPQVSWISAPTEYCEHPDETPNAGENFTARLLAALVENPEVWSKTAFIITYDENDGFFDHMPSVMAPLNSDRGLTTLADPLVGEVYNNQPIGLGPRVPTMVLSPWSKGGRVCSQLFDHTSLIRFVEEWLVQGRGLPRASVTSPNISPWRRAVCGDLTSAFNFSATDTAWPDSVPDSAVYFKGWGSATASPPAVQTLPQQETAANGMPRPACALPYQSAVLGQSPGAKQFSLGFSNTGSATAAFIVYSGLRTDGPWHYTVEPGESIQNQVWNWSGDRYHLNAQSHNGFAREFGGSLSSPSRNVVVELQELPATQSVRITVTNNGSTSASLEIVDNAYGDANDLLVDVAAGEMRHFEKPVVASHGWYDIGVTLEGDDNYWRRLAGHVEGAGLDYTDPVLSGLAHAVASPVPGTVVTPPPAATFSANTRLMRVGDSITFTWTNLPADPTNWIGFYRVGQTPGSTGSLKWDYVSTAAGSMTFSGLGVGDYFVGLFLADAYGEAAPRLPLKVVVRGDVNADGRIDATDRDVLRNAVGSCVDQPRYQPLADFDGDHCITQADYRSWYEIFSKL